MGNQIKHEGLQSLVDAIVNYNKTLQRLILSRNESINDASGSSLLQLIKKSQSLIYLDVNSCDLSRTVKNQLMDAASARSGFKLDT
jgi:Ran GTPase-activating protein (RanGAP) involved in mRNA processing and transport